MINFFKKNKEPKDLKEVLDQFKDLEKKVDIISHELENLKKTGKFSIQKMGVVRYNPFSGVGSNQSFSLTLLDGNNDGMVITSLYARDGNRVYAKTIEEGKSQYSLSGEEKQAISEAMNSKIPNIDDQ